MTICDPVALSLCCIAPGCRHGSLVSCKTGVVSTSDDMCNTCVYIVDICLFVLS